MERILARKPLTPAERAAKPAVVCVTGAAGFVASQITCRLLAAGHTVHATYREEDLKSPNYKALNELPEGIKKRLLWFKANLLEHDTYDAAVQGCKYVIHTAAPVEMGCPEKKAFSHSVNPVVQGVINVFGAVNKAQSVERVVFTSSIWAAMCGIHHDDPNHVLTENDWNTDLGTHMPYYMAKTISEWEAWAIAAQQDRWKLVVICPANILGPPLAACKGSESVASAMKLLNGTMYPFIPPLDTPLVDVADIATAHCLAMVTKEAHGRYIVCSGTWMATELAEILRKMFPQHWVPFIKCPYWLAYVVFKVTGMLGIGWLNTTYGKKTKVSCQKALTELKGLGPLIPLEQTLKEMGESLMEMGLLAKKPVADISAAAPTTEKVGENGSTAEARKEE